MSELDHLLERNRRWAARLVAEDPEFFDRLSRQQAPRYLWIGCSDSRVPATDIVDMLPGEMFVHRNVANVVVHTDFNLISVLQYAVDVLRVRHIIVCGHYGCGGVRAALEHDQHGLIDNWLCNIRDVYYKHRAKVDTAADEMQRVDLLCELNVFEQVTNVCHTTVVQGAWARNRALSVHGWIYGVHDGLIKDLEVTTSGPEQVEALYRLTHFHGN